MANGEHETETEVLSDSTGIPSALPALNREEIDIQIATARRYPRSVVMFKREALECATLDEETAGSMFYVLPRAGKKIEGPSVRLAEIVGSAWGHLRYGSRTVEVGMKYVRAQGVCFDLQKNIACTVEVTRRITNKHGQRYDDDMIGVTSNAACSIALRQAIFKVVPFAYVKDIYEAAKKVSLGKGFSMEQKRQAAFDWFAKFSVVPAQVLKILDRKGVEDITIDDLITLQGIKTAIQDGDTTMEQVLAELEPKPPSEIVKPANGEVSKLDQLADRLKAKKEASHVGAGTGEGAVAATEAAGAPAPGVADPDPGGQGDPAPDRGDPNGPVGAPAREPLAGTLPQPQTMDATSLSRLRWEIADLEGKLFAIPAQARERDFLRSKHLRRGDGTVESIAEAPEGPLMRLRGELGLLANRKAQGKGKR